MEFLNRHPNNPSPKLVAYNTEKGIHSTGYSCLGSTDSPLAKDETLFAIAKAKGKTPQQVLLAWGVQKGWVRYNSILSSEVANPLTSLWFPSPLPRSVSKPTMNLMDGSWHPRRSRSWTICQIGLRSVETLGCPSRSSSGMMNRRCEKVAIIDRLRQLQCNFSL